MIKRDLDANLELSLINNEDFIYYNLVKFEKPIPTSSTGATTNAAEDYSYITDAPTNISWDDGSIDSSGSSNGTQVYVANKLLSMGGVQETIEARATSMNLKLAATALGVVTTNTTTISSTGYIDTPIDLVDLGFREGDKVQILKDSAPNDEKFVRFDRFTAESSSGLDNSRVYITDLSSPGVSTDTDSYTLALASDELTALTVSKEPTLYSNYINREVYVYRAHASPDTGEMTGEPFLLFKGIISKGALNDSASQASITWSLTSHWGDFVRVQGRSTSDTNHRALDMTGAPDPDALIRPEYAADYGFMHSERSVNALGQFQTKELRYKLKKKGGIAGLLGGKKLVEYYADVSQDVDLRFNLSATYLPVVYGVQKIASIPVFADVDANNPADVYVAYAMCEGEIGGVYDIHIEDNPSVCSDAQDYDNRNPAAASVEGANVSVVCYGRADQGFVLAGDPYVDGTEANIPYVDRTVNDYWLNPRNRGGGNYGLRPQVPQIDAEPTLPTGNAAGLTHETTYKFSTPIDASFVIHTGKADQSADQVILNKALSNSFKIQQDFFEGDPANYWSASHQLLDTAYVTGKFTLSEGEETLPDYSFVVKGKYVECYNYDASFKAFKGQTSDTSFDIGDIVTVTASGGGGSNIHSNVQIIDKWTQYDKDGTPDIRFRWRTNHPNPGDTLVDLEGSSGTHNLVTMTGPATWNMHTYEYAAATGTVSSSPLAGTSEYSYTDSAGEGVLTLTLTDTNLSAQLSAIVSDGHNLGMVSITTAPQYSFLIKDYSYPTLTLGGYSAAAETLANTDFSGAKVYLSNAVISQSANVGDKVIVTRNDSGIVSTREKEIVAVTGSTVFTNTAFDPALVPGLDSDWNSVSDTYQLGPTNDERVSINPAIQLLDYITNRRYGKGLSYQNDLKLRTFLESARLCDDRSKVSVAANAAAVAGDIYTYSNNDGLVFQGKVISSNPYGTKNEVQFDEVIGKLGRKWKDGESYVTGDIIWGYDHVAIATADGTLTRDAFLGLTGVTSITLDRSGGGTLAVHVGADLGGLSNTNTVVRSWSEDTQSYSSTGYTLYDSDDVKYWKYLGWDDQNQRNVTRHQMNQVINTNTPLFDNINSMLQQFNGIMRYANGRYELDIKTAMPDSFTDGFDRISEDDIIGEIKLDDKGQRGAFNSIAANIVDPQNKFGSRSVSFFDSTYLKEDRGVPKQGTFSMPGISNYFNARSNIIQYLKESRYGLTISFTRDAKGYLSLAGKIIAINYDRFGWVDKPFRIETLTLQTNGLVAIVATEHNDDAYLIDFSDRDYTEGGYSTPARPIAPPINLTATQTLRGEIELTWENSEEYDPSTHVIEIWNTEANKDQDGKYITTIPDVYEGNDFANATLYDATVGVNYVQDGFGSNDLHVWFYWIRYMVPSIYTRKDPAYSPFLPIKTNPGVEGRAVSSIGLDALTVIMDNPTHTLPANDLGVVYDYTGSGTRIWLFEGPDLLDFDPSVYPPQDGTWQIVDNGTDSTNIDDIVAATDISSGGISPERYAVVASQSGMGGDTASITYHIEGNRFAGETIDLYTTQTFTIASSGADGDQGSDGINSKAVKLTADAYTIIYDEGGINPVPSAITLSAAAQNVNEPWFQFTGHIIDDDTGFSATNTKAFIPFPQTYSNTPYTVRVDVSENNPDEGPVQNDTSLAFDTISIASVKNGIDGSAGAEGWTVNLTAGTQVFTYNANGQSPINPMDTPDVPGNLTQTLIRANPFNYSGNPWLQWYLNDVPQGGPQQAGDPLSNIEYTYTAPPNSTDMPDKIEVELIEDNGGSPGNVMARDQITMSALQFGSGAISMILSNEAHTIPVTNTGVFDFDYSGTDIRVYEGGTELVYDGDGQSPGTWDFVNPDGITGINVIPGTITDLGNYVQIGPLQGWDENGDSERDDPMTPTEFTAVVNYQIDGQRYDGTAFSTEKRQSFSLSIGGIDGSPGGEYIGLELSQSDLTFKYKGDGTLIGPSQIDFEVEQYGSNETINWMTRYYDYTLGDWVNTATETWMSPTSGFTSVLTEANFQSALVESGNRPIVVWASFYDDPRFYQDHVTINELTDGEANIVAQINNPSDIVDADADGTNYDLSGTGGTFIVWKGTAEVPRLGGAGDPVFSLAPGSNPTYDGLTMQINSDGTYQVTDTVGPTPHEWTSNALAWKLRMVYEGVTVDNWYSINKSKQGTQGPIGPSGTDAYSVAVSADSLTVIYNADDTHASPNNITFTVTDLSSTEAEPLGTVWYKWYVTDNQGISSLEQSSAAPGGATYVYNVSSTVSSDMPEVVSVDMSDGSAGVPVARDAVSLTGLQYGSNAINAVLSNDSHSVPVSVDPVVEDYTASGTTIQVFEGPNALIYKTSAPAAGEWTFTTTVSDITAGPVEVGSNGTDTATIDKHNTMLQDIAYVEYNITGFNSKNEAFAQTKKQTLTKSWEGVRGSIGPNGENALTPIMPNAAHTIPCDKDGNVVAGGMTGSGTIMRLFEGNTPLIYQKTGDPIGDGQWSISSVAVSNMDAADLPYTNGDGTSTLTIGDHDGMTGGLGTEVGSITYNITGKYINGDALPAFEAVQSFSKSIAGDDGESAVTVRGTTLASESPYTYYSAAGTNPNPSTITMVAYCTGLDNPHFNWTGGPSAAGGSGADDGATYYDGVEVNGAGTDTRTFTAPSNISSAAYPYNITVKVNDAGVGGQLAIDTFPITAFTDFALYYIKPTNGTVIRSDDNPAATLTIEARKIFNGVDSLVESPDVTTLRKLDNTLLGDGYTATLGAADINNELVVYLKDGFGGTTLDTITLVDVTDGGDGVYGYIVPSNGLAFTRASDQTTWTPSASSTDLDVTFVQSGAAIARAARRVNRTSSGILTSENTTHPSNDTGSVSITMDPVGEGEQTLTVTFTENTTGNSVSETVMTSMAGSDGQPGAPGTPGDPGAPGDPGKSVIASCNPSAQVALMQGTTVQYTLAGNITNGYLYITDTNNVGLQCPANIIEDGVNKNSSTFWSFEGGSSSGVAGGASMRYKTSGDIRCCVYTGSGLDGIIFFTVDSSGIWASAQQVTFTVTGSYDNVTHKFPVTLTKSEGPKEVDLISSSKLLSGATSKTNGFRIDTDGDLYKTQTVSPSSYTSYATWNLGSRLANNYQVRMVENYNSGATLSGTLNSWLTLSADKTWSINEVDANWEGTLSIRDENTLAILDSCTVTFNNVSTN